MFLSRLFLPTEIYGKEENEEGEEEEEEEGEEEEEEEEETGSIRHLGSVILNYLHVFHFP